MSLLSIDLGTTNIKTAIYDSQLYRLGLQSATINYITFNNAWIEFDPNNFRRLIIQLLKRTFSLCSSDPANISTIAITSQAQTFILLDKNNEYLTNFISWVDTRATENMVDLKSVLGEEFAMHCSFSEPLAELSLAKVHWFNKHCPDIAAKIHHIEFLPSWLIRQFGGQSFIDPNLAAMSGFYSIPENDWWQPALDACNLTKSQFPFIQNWGDELFIDAFNPEFGFQPGTKIIMAGNDQTGCAIGCSLKQGEFMATLGSALVLYHLAGVNPGPYHKTNCWGPYPGSGNGYYELAYSSFGTLALDWARHLLLPGEGIDSFNLLVEAGYLRSMVSPHTYFYPERIGKANAWIGISEHTLQALAVLEGITFTLKDLSRKIANSDEEIKKMLVTGGGSQNNYWLELISNVFNCQVEKSQGDALLGAAMLASSSIPTELNSEKTFVYPDQKLVEVYQLKYTAWRKNRPID